MLCLFDFDDLFTYSTNKAVDLSTFSKSHKGFENVFYFRGDCLNVAELVELRVGIEVVAFEGLACFVAVGVVAASPGLRAVIKEIF